MIRNVSVFQQVVDFMQRNIATGRWEVGKKIPSENRLAEELGVSRSTIRSAVGYLAGLGILRTSQGKGTVLLRREPADRELREETITSEDCRDVRQVLEFRRMLEPEVCRLAVLSSGGDCIPDLEACLEAMRQARNRQDSSRFVRADMDFHETICRCSGNPLAEKCLRRVFDETWRSHEQMNVLFGYESGIRFHAAILDAFRNRDPEAARRLMEQHMQEAMDALASML